MPSPRDRVRWPVAGLVACLLLALLLSAADRWLWRGRADAPPPAYRVPDQGWLTVLPPPTESEADGAAPERPTPRRTPAIEAPWWKLAWQARVDDLAAATIARPAPPDSTLLLLTRLGIDGDLATRARPDSVLAARLIWLSRREGYLPQEIRPLLRALGRAEAYRAVAARAAEMYEEFLDQEIITPN